MPRAKVAGLLGKKCQVQATIAYQKRGILCKPCKANDLRGITADSVPTIERIGEKGNRYIVMQRYLLGPISSDSIRHDFIR